MPTSILRIFQGGVIKGRDDVSGNHNEGFFSVTEQGKCFDNAAFSFQSVRNRSSFLRNRYFDYASLEKAADRIRKGEIVGHLVLVPNPSFHDGDMDLKDGLINRADKKYTYGNIAVFSPKIFAGEKPEFSKLFPWLYQFVDQQLVSGEIYKGPWANVGTPEELAKCESMGCFFNETDIS